VNQNTNPRAEILLYEGAAWPQLGNKVIGEGNRWKRERAHGRPSLPFECSRRALSSLEGGRHPYVVHRAQGYGGGNEGAGCVGLGFGYIVRSARESQGSVRRRYRGDEVLLPTAGGRLRARWLDRSRATT